MVEPVERVVGPVETNESDVVAYEVRDGVAWVTLNRPEYRNAQNSAMTYALDAAFTRAVDDDEVKVIVLSGNGKHFCAGIDRRIFKSRARPRPLGKGLP